MTFGVQADEAESHRILDAGADAGVTFIDTANNYPFGQEGERAGLTEEIIGRWLHGRRADVIIASKFSSPMGPNPWDRGGSSKHIFDAIEGSLRRLQTDHIDLYQMHFFDDRTPLDETLTALDQLVQQGKVRYIGCSNYASWQLSRAIGRSEALGITRYDSVQPRYNLLFRNIERDILPAATHDGLAVMPYNPLAGGVLSGKHRGLTNPPPGGRFDLPASGPRYRSRYWVADKFDVVEEIAVVADELGVPMTTLAIAWVASNPAITAPIIGASRAEQLADSIAGVDLVLDVDVLARLDDITRRYRVVDVER
jgi:aryl-alcohol dehydrogenase-like predicted oxidoreductase